MKKAGSVIFILLLILTSGLTIVRTIQLENQVDQLNTSLTDLSQDYTLLSDNNSKITEELRRYTGNPFFTELWPGQMQSENISGMHWYSYLAGSLVNRSGVIQYPEQGASYIIFKSGSTTYAKNGSTGQIDSYSTTDDIPIQYAIDAVNGTGGTIFIQSGIYTITSTLNLTNRASIQLVGSSCDFGGTEGTVLRAGNGLNDNLILIKGSASFKYLNILIASMTLNGRASLQASGDIINIDYAYNIDLRDLMIRDAKDSGLYASALQESVLSRIFFMGCDTGSCVDLRSTGGCAFYDIEITGAYTYGVIIRDSNDNDFNFFDVYQNNRAGFYFYSGNANNTIVGGKFHDNENEGLLIDGGSKGTVVIGTRFANNNFDGVGIRGAVRINNATGITPTTQNTITYCNFWNETYAFNEEHSSDYNKFVYNNVMGATNTFNNQVGANSIIDGNIGFVTRNRGTSEASNDDWIAHGLAAEPTMVQLTIEEVDANYFLQLKATNVTHFQIYLYDATAGAVEVVDKTINWYSEYDP